MVNHNHVMLSGFQVNSKKHFEINKHNSVSVSDVISYDRSQVFSCEVQLIQTKKGEM